MDVFKDFDGEIDVLFDENVDSQQQQQAYDNIFYLSPTYSTDSGVDLFLTDLNEFMPVTNENTLDDILSPLFRQEEDKQQSTVVTNLDHSYSRSANNVDELSVPINAKNVLSSKKDFTAQNLKSIDKEEQMPVSTTASYEIKLDFPKAQISKSGIHSKMSSLSDNNFSYINENGKAVVVDKSRKNAEMARLNRRRKKHYVNNLEAEMKSLKSKNKKLIANKRVSDKKINALVDEVKYLRSVLKNKTVLSSLINAVSNIPGIDVSIDDKIIDASSSSARMTRERLPGKRGPPDYDGEFNGGVCLHVSQNKVKIEFCPKCNKQ